MGVLLSSQNLIGFGDMTGMAVTAAELQSERDALVEENAFTLYGASLIVKYKKSDSNEVYTLRYDSISNKYTYQGGTTSNTLKQASYDTFEQAYNSLQVPPAEGYVAQEIMIQDSGNHLIGDPITFDSATSEGGTVFTAAGDISGINTLVYEHEQKKYDALIIKAKKTESITTLATQLNVNPTAVTEEETAINTYLHADDSSYAAVNYDIITDTYSGTIGGSTVTWDDTGKTMYIVTTSGGTTTKLYTEKKNGNTKYYQETCTLNKKCQTTTLSGNEAEAAKEKYETVKDAYEKVEDHVESGIEAGQVTGITTTVRKESYMNQIYNEQERQTVGILTGYLNNWVNEKLGSWSRGRPAWICKYIFGLEYYRNSGWVSMPGNTSSTQLQSTLISHSSTIIIDGEKEEITDTLYRYAYTIRLLSNQSAEWTTYLYNSCSQENSQEQFYDYGALGAGEYYAFHYAGAGDQDMIFDCTIEQCLYDQACVVFSDGSAPVCVSLVNGEGFTTPTAGSDYDCAVS